MLTDREHQDWLERDRQARGWAQDARWHQDLRFAILERLQLSWPAIAWLCRFNGYKQFLPHGYGAPAHLHFAPNEAAKANAEYWGAQPVDAQEARVAWSRRPGPWIDHACKACGKQCDTAPIDGSGTWCEACCPDHDYEYCSDFREHRCKHCDRPADPDWYDVEP